MNLEDLDRMLAERESRLEKKKEDGIETFADQCEREEEAKQPNPEMDLRMEGQSLVNRMQQLEQDANEYMDTMGVPEPPQNMMEEAQQIHQRLQEIDMEIQQIQMEKQNAQSE